MCFEAKPAVRTMTTTTKTRKMKCTKTMHTGRSLRTILILFPTGTRALSILQVVSSSSSIHNNINFSRNKLQPHTLQAARGCGGRGGKRQRLRCPPSPLPKYFIFIFVVTELADMPVGTGTLYVPMEKHPSKLQREDKVRNVTETEESKVVQFLALGGHQRFTGLREEPNRSISAVHAGPGQQVFGYSDKQRADLLLFFDGAEGKYPAQLHYHNYHGEHWHYTGHVANVCPKADGLPARVKEETETADRFKFAYAAAMTSVFPDKVIFNYSVSWACHYFHGRVVEPNDGRTFFDLSELLYTHEKYKDKVCIPTTERFLDTDEIKSRIRDGSLTGFATIIGGRERGSNSLNSQKFGYCVQNYAPKPSELSPFTRQQIKDYFSFTTDEQVDKYIEGLLPRTLNSTTFHTEETVSTSYLRWLMTHRNFDDFKITHFIRYKFTDDTKDFIQPLLERRHKYKQEGNKTAADVVKLIGNGGFG